VKLVQPVDLVSPSNWEVEVCKISCSVQYIGENPALIYCNLISPQFVDDSTVSCMRTFVCLQQHYVSKKFETCIMCPSSSGYFRKFESSS